jgi:hypothetical protein
LQYILTYINLSATKSLKCIDNIKTKLREFLILSLKKATSFEKMASTRRSAQNPVFRMRLLYLIYFASLISPRVPALIRENS